MKNLLIYLKREVTSLRQDQVISLIIIIVISGAIGYAIAQVAGNVEIAIEHSMQAAGVSY